MERLAEGDRGLQRAGEVAAVERVEADAAEAGAELARLLVTEVGERQILLALEQAVAIAGALAMADQPQLAVHGRGVDGGVEDLVHASGQGWGCS